MRYASTLLAGILALTGFVRAADACSPPPENWMFDVAAPSGDRALAPGDPVLLRGSTFFDMSEAEVLASFDVEVLDADGAIVPGSLSPAPGKDDYFWQAEAPLVEGEAYTLNVYERYEWDDERYLARSVELRVGERWLDPAPGSLAVDAVRLVEREITGACLEEEFCGGCFEAEVLGFETHWRLDLALTVPAGSYDAVRTMRVALGGDADEARAVLARTRPFDLHRVGGAFGHTVSGGARALWPSNSACAAVQVHDPIEGVVLDDVQCFAVPAADGPIDQEGPDAPIETDEPEPTLGPAFDDGGQSGADAGCDASGSSGGTGGLWALLLLGGLGLGRRRRAVLATLAAALLAVGCTPEGSAPDGTVRLPEPVDPIDPVDPERPVEPVEPVEPADDLPPPVFGGALGITGSHAVIGDPDRDQLYIVDLSRGTRVTLAARRPGRVAFDAAGETAYVSLRDAGQVLVVDVAAGLERQRFDVCAAPRGLAVQGETLHVACAGGALLGLDAASGRIQRRIELGPDLRDVVVDGDRLHVSRFKQPALYTLDADGAVLAVRAPRTDDALTDGAPGAPTAAWRTVAMPGGGALMLHQRARLDTVRTETPGGYGDAGSGFESSCGGSIVDAEVTAFPPLDGDLGAAPRMVVGLRRGVVVVDMAVVEGGLAFAAAGDGAQGQGWIPIDLDDAETWGDCLLPQEIHTEAQGQYTAVAAQGVSYVAFSRQPAGLLLTDGRQLPLSDASAFDVGHTLFHNSAGRGIACASCHPEGGEDGHAWLFEGHGLRRTQELRGGIAGSAPFHWTGDMRDIRHLMDEVLTRRMGGPEIDDAQAQAMLAWIDAQPVPTVDPIGGGDPVAGALVFDDATVGCAGCHSGARFTDDQRYDVGTGGLYSTPTLLGVGQRGAMMHDGCGLDLRDRFDPICGGGDAHGRTGHLSATQLDDLIAYLATL